jgi:hypothetical protein
MDFKSQLLTEASRANIDLIVSTIDGDNTLFDQLFTYIYESDGHLANRAGWVVEKCAEKHPSIVEPHLDEIIDFLPNIKFGGLRRVLLKVLILLHIPDNRMSEIVDICLTWLESPKEKVAVKVYSMRIIADFCKSEPEMIPEFLSILENHYDRNSFAFQSRANKIFEEFKDYI